MTEPSKEEFDRLTEGVANDQSIAAGSQFDLYMSWRRAGFSPEQAIYLLAVCVFEAPVIAPADAPDLPPDD